MHWLHAVSATICRNWFYFTQKFLCTFFKLKLSRTVSDDLDFWKLFPFYKVPNILAKQQ